MYMYCLGYSVFFGFMLCFYVQWISIRENNCVIQWIEIYPLDSIIHLLNNRGLLSTT